ncbi:MAG: hypothetical protein KF841_16405 [Phycisphaerae bacterium]|nr:hypothetical protein [Phycisphaerae bacterium]
MIRYRCDGCDEDLARDGSNHFIVKIDAFAAAGKLEFTREELERDHAAEMKRLLEELASRSPDDIEDQVYRAMRYDLCPACHRRFLLDPLARLRSLSGADSGPTAP